MSVFDNYAVYYDLLNNSKNYKSECEYLINHIKKHKAGSRDILEFGSGTGKHAKYLINNKFSLVGVEASKKMIENAPANLQDCLPYGDIRTFKVNKKFDVVLSIYHVISYLNNDNDILSCFNNNANNHLKKDGIFMFDVWYAPAVLNLGVETRVRRFENSNHKIVRIAESNLKIKKYM